MLHKARRIARHDFPVRAGTVFGTEHFSIRATRTRDAHARFSVIVSKKVAASSVARHTIKRRSYEALASIEKKNRFPAGAYCINAKKGADAVPYKDLALEMKDLHAQILSSIEKRRAFV